MIINLVHVMILSVILLCLTTSTPLAIAKTTTKKQNSLSLKLLHRSSIPLFKDETFQDFLEINKRSFMRNSKFGASADLLRPTSAHLYFVNLSIGYPPVPQYLAFDTGSSVVWVAGQSTNKRTFLYQPRSSHTHKRLSCSSPECYLSRMFSCSKWGSNLCGFQINYADNMHMAVGYLGFDRFAFKSSYYCGYEEFCSDTMDNVLFGYAPVTKGVLFQSSNFNGVLGLSPEITSFMHNNLPNKLSYCIRDIYDKNNSQGNFLELGDSADLSVLNASMYVPLNENDRYYGADMRCIDFGESCIPIEPETFKYHSDDPYTGVIFDSGTIYTYLADVAYDLVALLVDNVMGTKVGIGRPKSNADVQLCYNGQRESISDFPPLSFHFVDKDVDLSLRLEKNSLFYNKNDEIFCITMIKSSSKNDLMKNFTIIGLAAQQNHTMLFDMERSRMSIQYTSCASDA